MSQKLYNTDRERKDARNLRLKSRRKEDKIYNRYQALRTNFNIAVAKHFSHITKCACCGFQRKDYFPEVHHIVHKKDWWKDTLANLIPLCFACHRQLHMHWPEALTTNYNFNLTKYKESIAHIITPTTYKPPENTFTYLNHTFTLKDWAKITWINYRTINYRRKAGWNTDSILKLNNKTFSISSDEELQLKINTFLDQVSRKHYN